MSDKIQIYYKDHKASRQEAKVIAEYYLEAASKLQKIETYEDLKETITFIEHLKAKVRKYRHHNSKSTLSRGLETKVLTKLRDI